MTLLTGIVGRVAQGVGNAYDYATPGSGKSTLTNAGNAIVDPNRVYTGSLNPFAGSGGSSSIHNGGLSGFTQVSHAAPGITGQGNSSAQPGSTTDTGGVAGAGTNTPGYDPAAYQQAIGNTNSALGRLGNTLNSGNSAIDSSYTNALNQLLLGRNQSQQTYNTNKQQTAQDYVGTKNTIASNAGASLHGLQRLLGSRGAGGGSAYTQVAPEAVARDATLQRNDASNTFGHNNQALDTNWNNYLTGYDNSVADVGAQRDEQRQHLQSSIDTNRASLLQTLAQLTGAQGGNAQPFIDQANQVLDRQSNYNVAPINYQTQAYNAPSLNSYATNPNATPTFQGQPSGNDYFSPYLAALLGKKQPGVA